MERTAGLVKGLTPGRHPVVASLAALVVRAVALLLIIEVAGGPGLVRDFSRLQDRWVWVVAVAEVATYPAYLLAYRSVTGLDERRPMKPARVARIVLAGFGPLAVAGGFGADREAMSTLEEDPARARRLAGAMATLELAVFAPTICAVSIAAVGTGERVEWSLVWPWVVGVPVGVALAGWATVPGHGGRVSCVRGRHVERLGRAVENLASVRTMALAPRRYGAAWVGTALYWFAELLAFFAAMRASGFDIGIGRSVLAYASGYVGSRRSLPLGGAGLTEALLVYSLHELGQPLGRALVTVMIYRLFNLRLVVVPALLANRGLRPQPTGAA